MKQASEKNLQEQKRRKIRQVTAGGTFADPFAINIATAIVLLLGRLLTASVPRFVVGKVHLS